MLTHVGYKDKAAYLRISIPSHPECHVSPVTSDCTVQDHLRYCTAHQIASYTRMSKLSSVAQSATFASTMATCMLGLHITSFPVHATSCSCNNVFVGFARSTPQRACDILRLYMLTCWVCRPMFTDFTRANSTTTLACSETTRVHIAS